MIMRHGHDAGRAAAGSLRPEHAAGFACYAYSPMAVVRLHFMSFYCALGHDMGHSAVLSNDGVDGCPVRMHGFLGFVDDCPVLLAEPFRCGDPCAEGLFVHLVVYRFSQPLLALREGVVWPVGEDTLQLLHELHKEQDVSTVLHTLDLPSGTSEVLVLCPAPGATGASVNWYVRRYT